MVSSNCLITGCGAQAGVLSIHLHHIGKVSAQSPTGYAEWDAYGGPKPDSLLCMIRGVARTVLVHSTK